MFNRHVEATTKSSDDLRSCYVRGNDASYEAQDLEETREKALTLRLQSREKLRMRKEKRRERQVSSENLIVLYENVKRSLERDLHSSTYEELLHLERR